MSSLCSASTSSVCHSCLLVRAATLCSNEDDVGAKVGEVGLDEAGVELWEDDMDVDVVTSSWKCQPQPTKQADYGEEIESLSAGSIVR